MLLPHLLFLSGVAVLILGRFHFLFRDVSDRGNFATPASFWVRIGSVVIADLLLAAALVALLVRR